MSIIKTQDNPFNTNGFNGTWAIRTHDLIPEAVLNYLNELFPTDKAGTFRLDRIDISEINQALNDIWAGPNSLPILEEARLASVAKRVLESTQEKKVIAVTN